MAVAGIDLEARSGRISRCSLDAEPLAEAALWLNRYAKYWQAQFETLALHLTRIEQERETP